MLVKRRQGPKWFISDVRHHQKCLRTLKRKFNIHPTQERKNKILKMERLLQSKPVQAKSDYETKLIESHNSSNSSAIYSYICSISNQSVIPPTLHLDNIVAVLTPTKHLCLIDTSTLYSLGVHFNYPLQESWKHLHLSSVTLQLVNWMFSEPSDLWM